MDIPGRTVRADIRLDVRAYIRLSAKITDVRVELSMQPRISIINFTL